MKSESCFSFSIASQPFVSAPCHLLHSPSSPVPSVEINPDIAHQLHQHTPALADHGKHHWSPPDVVLRVDVAEARVPQEELDTFNIANLRGGIQFQLEKSNFQPSLKNAGQCCY